jgi:hypothetical protein
VSIVLGSINKWAGHGSKRKYKSLDETMMYVPILKTIETLLEDVVISTEV